MNRWDNSFSLGIKLIDDQHKKILDFAFDSLTNAPQNEEERDEYFKEVIAQVVEYIKVHFATEEGIMLATKFPDYCEHKKAHEAFVMAVLNSVRDYETGNRMALENFSNFTKKWVLTHIAVMDIKYIEYLKKITISIGDGKRGVSMWDLNINTGSHPANAAEHLYYF